MIEVTADAVIAAWDALPVAAQEAGDIDLGDMAAVLAAALTIVERHYRVNRRCPMGDPWCESGVSTCSRCVLDRLHQKLGTSPSPSGGAS